MGDDTSTPRRLTVYLLRSTSLASLKHLRIISSSEQENTYLSLFLPRAFMGKKKSNIKLCGRGHLKSEGEQAWSGLTQPSLFVTLLLTTPPYQWEIVRMCDAQYNSYWES